MNRPQELVDHALSAATLPVAVVVTDRTEANLRWALNSLTTNGEMHAVTVTVVATSPVDGGMAVGTTSREVSGVDDVADLVAAAEATARSGPPAEEAMPLVEDYPHDDAYDSAPEQTSIDVFAPLATGLGEAFRSAIEDGHLLFGFAELIVTTSYLGTSTGLRRRTVQPEGRLELNAKSSDTGQLQAQGASAWIGQATRDFSDVDVTALHAEVVKRLGWSARRVELPAGRYETLLPPSAVADLMICLYWSATAREAEEGRTVFSAPGGATLVGQRLTSMPVTLRSDPGYPGLECSPFVLATAAEGDPRSVFDNGLPTAATDWVRSGELRELIRSRGWAARTGQPTRPAIDNLIMTAEGTRTLDEMIASTKWGLLLTCLWYIREVDPERLLLTGLTRDGVYLVEDGRVVAAVNNFRFNESPVELLGRITEVGVTEQTLCREWNDFFTRTAVPAVRVPDFNMSTVSQAS